MRFLVRLLGGIWLVTLVVSAGFAYLEVREERERQIESLKRRATLVGAAVAEASERLVTRGARTGYERVLTRFGTPERGLAIYDTFGGVLAATADVRPFLGPLSPLVSDAIRSNEPVAGFQNVAGRLTWVHVVPVQQDERAAGAAAVLLDAQYLDSGEWDLWRRTAVRMGVLMLLVTGITWALVRWSVTRPIARIAEWTKQMKAGHPVAPPPNADREAGERVGLPSADPTYTLRRVWLSDEEEAGYYYGFANEGLWPLCHIVHERPRFRAADWGHYRAVNERFAKALLQEMEAVEAPIVLVQDYHFALLPRLVKEARPDARVALFWHIPWPNFEAVGICPWQSDILLGMLGADLVGFHTQIYCHNFLETVERAIEGRIEWDRFTVVRGQHTTHVRPFPISVAPDLGAAV